MRTLFFALLLLLASAGSSRATPPAAASPDTPAGRALQAWLDAFNSGDSGRIKEYCKQFDHPNPPERMSAFAQQVGGFELIAIRSSEPRRVVFVVREKNSPTTALGKLALRDGAATRIADFTLRAVPPGMRPEDLELPVDAAARARVLDGVATKLTEFYIYPELAKKMIDALRAHQKKGEYDSITDGDALAAHVTKDLQAVSHDGHLHVFTSPEPLPPQDPGEDDPPTDRDRADMLRNNCAFVRVEHLPHNIGYVKFNGFADPTTCGATVTAAMGLVANVDALIFDVRENGGGDPSMVSYVLSYLFAERTHVNDIWVRKTNKTTEYWTRPELPGKKLAGVPVYVLTSKLTFSGAEEFTNDLKALKRAKIVGETTGGGAHPTMPKRIDDHFGIAVPFARPINPVTKKDWEGSGVEPDVKVPAARALDEALTLARAQLDAARPKPGRDDHRNR